MSVILLMGLYAGFTANSKIVLSGENVFNKALIHQIYVLFNAVIVLVV